MEDIIIYFPHMWHHPLTPVESFALYLTPSSILQSVNQAIVTMKQLDDVLPAINGMDGFNFNGRRITVT